MLSIIIASLNSESVIERSLNSILCQTCRDYEVLVADGGSTDNTVEILKDFKYSRNLNISWWISERDSGIADAWNKAIGEVKGEWILFLGADDELYDTQVIESFRRRSSGLESFEIIYGRVHHVAQSGGLWMDAGMEWSSVKKLVFSQGGMYAHQGVFHNRLLFEERSDNFDTSFKIGMDYEFFVRKLSNAKGMFIDDLIVTKMHFGGVSSNFNDTTLHSEYRRARLKNGIPETISTRMLALRYKTRSLGILIFGHCRFLKIYNVVRVLFGKSKLPTG